VQPKVHQGLLVVSYNVVVLNNVVNHHEELRAGYGTPEMIYGIRVHSVLVCFDGGVSDNRGIVVLCYYWLHVFGRSTDPPNMFVTNGLRNSNKKM
jgi:hypothetical protein